MMVGVFGDLISRDSNAEYKPRGRRLKNSSTGNNEAYANGSDMPLYDQPDV